MDAVGNRRKKLWQRDVVGSGWDKFELVKNGLILERREVRETNGCFEDGGEVVRQSAARMGEGESQWV